MQQREEEYFSATKDPVYFGVGSYGADPKTAGFCYRMKIKGVKKDIIMQA